MRPAPAIPRAAAEPGAGRMPAAVLEPLRELVDYLGELHGLLRALAELAGQKLAALRAADAARLHACAAREGSLLQEIFRTAQGRAAVLARLAQALHIADLRTLRLAGLADRLPEPQASLLRARSTALAQVAAELQRKNTLVAAVAHDLQAHIRGVFAELARVGQEPSGYGPAGRPQAGSRRCWVDAVG